MWLMLWAWVSTDSRLRVRPSEQVSRGHAGTLLIRIYGYALASCSVRPAELSIPPWAAPRLQPSHSATLDPAWLSRWAISLGLLIDRATKRGEADLRDLVFLFAFIARSLAAAAYVLCPGQSCASIFAMNTGPWGS